MRRNMKLASGLIALVGAGATAHGAIVFSSVTQTGSLGGGFTTATGPNDIDISIPFANGTVGDPGVAATRSGSATFTFTVTGTGGDVLDRNILSVLGAIQGSAASVTIATLIEDLTPGNTGTIANSSIVISSANPPPEDAVITFSRSSAQIRVTNTLTFNANQDTAGIDLANVSLMEQRFVPAPGALGLVGVGGLVAMRRRRR